MAKKWQELEFLDYKERQIRRRAQKKRRLLDESEGGGDDAAEARTQVRILIGGIAAIVTVFIYFLVLRSGVVGPVGHGLEIRRMSGGVVLSGMLKDWKPEVDEQVPEDVRVVTNRSGKVELGLHVPDTRIYLFENSEVLFKGLRTGSSKDFQLDMEVIKGEAVFEFKNEEGIGILHVETPTGVELWGKLVYLKIDSTPHKTRVIVADGLVKAEGMGDKVIIPGDRQMISTAGEPITTPKALNVIREVWTW